MKTAMTICITAILTILIPITLVVAPDGPPAEDERWEKCNDRQDAGLEQLSNYLSKYEEDSIRVKTIPPCQRCNVTNLSSMKRTGDIQFWNFPTYTKHNMHIGFNYLRFSCLCETQIPSASPVEGLVHILWKEPRINFQLNIGAKEEFSQVPWMKVTSPINKKTVEAECTGSRLFVGACDGLRNVGALNAILTATIYTLFPKEARDIYELNKLFLSGLTCEHLAK